MENCESLECHLAGCVQECARSVHRAGCHHGQDGLTGGNGEPYWELNRISWILVLLWDFQKRI